MPFTVNDSYQPGESEPTGGSPILAPGGSRGGGSKGGGNVGGGGGQVGGGAKKPPSAIQDPDTQILRHGMNPYRRYWPWG